MKITYLGTGAYDSVPAAFCHCETCEYARKHRQKNVRGHQQVLINDDLLIDLSPETHYRANLLGIDLTLIKNILITHTHEDHFYPTLITNLQPNFSTLNEGEVFHFYGSKDLDNFASCYENTRAEIHTLSPFVPVKVGKYTVTPIKAMHPTENPFLYIISDGISTILYAHDTGFLPEEDFEFFKNQGVKLDFISLDCSKGDLEDLDYPWHQCLGRNVKTRERLLNDGVITNDTKIVLSHFSHKGKNTAYDIFAPIAQKQNFITSFDGLEIEV